MRRAAILVLAISAAHAQKFYPDDPLLTEPTPRRVEKAKQRKLSDYYDFFRNTFTKPGERQAPGRPIRAGAVNTLDEVMDGAWYTNRHYRKPMTVEELVRGPGGNHPPATAGPWTVLYAKGEGITPGFTIEDPRGVRYFMKVDPAANPEMTSAADVIGCKFFYALGYHVPDNYIVEFRRDQLRLTPKSTIKDALGKKRTMSNRDLEEILLKAPQNDTGRFRAVASQELKGGELGPFRYQGTRADDPNDVVAHEHRRDLRGLFVFCAWLGHEDSRAINTDDFLVDENGVRYIKHHLIDFGSILGSASDKANSPRSGSEHLFAWKPAVTEFFTLGLYVPRWARAHFPNLPSVGRFEYRIFDPEKFKPEYPNPAFANRLPDDTFWGAKQVMAFADEQIRAIVKTGRYRDPEAEEWVIRCLIERRNKVGRTYFAKVLPLDRFEVREGRLVFEDLGAKHGFSPPRTYSVQWSQFDNQTGRKGPLAGETTFAVPRTTGEYLSAEIRGEDAVKAVTVYLRMSAAGAQVAGIERRW